MDPILPTLVGIALVLAVISVFFERRRLPLVVAYILAGIALGPFGLRVLTDIQMVERLGEIGLVLLLFFLGLEMSLPALVTNWRISILGTSLQILATLLVVLALGGWLGWPVERSVLLGFVMALSSTAVVVPLLKQWGELNTPIGNDVLGIMLVQDIAVVPMIILVALMGGGPVTPVSVAMQLIGAGALIGLVVLLERGMRVPLPLKRVTSGSREIQVFAGVALCFGCATVTAALGLSAAMGAFVGGIIVASTESIEWIKETLEPFRVLLVAFFFVSVGGLLDVRFLGRELGVLLLLTAVTLILNTVLNATILRVLGRPWRKSLYGGALLSQIGEFSLVLAALGMQVGAISYFGYQSTVAVVALTMLASPFWIRVFRQRRGTEA